MRDLIFVGYLAALMLMALKRPFLFVLVYAYIDIVSPQRLSYFMLNSVPISLITFGLAVAGFLMDDKKDVRVTFRQGLLVVLLAYCGYTTITAAVPLNAWEKWAWVWKALVFAIFLPLTLRTRLRIEALALTLVLSIATLVISGGMKTVFSGGGGGYGSLVIQIDVNDGLFEGSIISLASISVISVIWWLAKHGTIYKPDWKVTIFALALTGACLLIPIGTQARTGLVCAGVLAILTLRFAKRRFLYLFVGLAVGAAAIPFIPASFTQRMETIKGYKADESASTRIAVWTWTWNYVKEHPMGGGFDVYRLNKIRYDLAKKVEKPAPGVEIFDMSQEEDIPRIVVDEGRAFHSAYFELLGEQGYPGFALWLLIQGMGVWQMERIRSRYAKTQDPEKTWIAPLASALFCAQVIYLVGAMFVGIGYQPFMYLLLALQIGLTGYIGRREKEARFVPMLNRRKPDPVPTPAPGGA